MGEKKDINFEFVAAQTLERFTSDWRHAMRRNVLNLKSNFPKKKSLCRRVQFNDGNTRLIEAEAMLTKQTKQ